MLGDKYEYFPTESRSEVALNLFNSVAQISHGRYANGFHRALSGVRGIGKTFVMQMVLALASLLFDNMVVLYLSMDDEKSNELGPLISAACAARGFNLPSNLNCHRIGEVLDAVETANKHVVCVLDEFQEVYERPTGDISSVVHDVAHLHKNSYHVVFVMGSSHHLMDCIFPPQRTDRYPYNFNNTKMAPLRLLPVFTESEFSSIVAKFGSDEVKNMDLRKAYCETGGVIRNVRLPNPSQFKPSISPSNPASIILTVLFDINQRAISQTNPFDPFKLAGFPIQSALTYLPAPFDSSSINRFVFLFTYRSVMYAYRWADSGWFRICQNHNGEDSIFFLYPSHFTQLQQSSDRLSFIEQVSLFFPEGRHLAECYEKFHAESLLASAFRIGDPFALDVEDVFSDTELSADRLRNLDHCVFKLKPDKFGFGLLLVSFFFDYIF